MHATFSSSPALLPAPRAATLADNQIMRAFTLLIVTFLFGGVAALPTPVSSASEEQALTTQPTSASSSPRELGSKKNKRRQKWATPSHSIAIPAFFHGDKPIDPKDGPDGVRGDPEDPDKENECANVDESKDTIYDGDDIPAATPDKSEVIDKVQQPIIDPPPCDPEKASPEKDSIVCPIKEEEVKVDEVFKSMEEARCPGAAHPTPTPPHLHTATHAPPRPRALARTRTRTPARPQTLH